MLRRISDAGSPLRRGAKDIGLVCGSDISALRKVEVESTDYAQREYGAPPEQVAALEKATDQRYRRLKRDKKLIR
jgi:hypothetical protein